MVGQHQSSAQKLLAVFFITIFVPGFLLAVFGARALWQEKRTADGQLRERLDRGAEAALRALEEEVAKLQSMVNEGSPPDRTFRSLPADSSWAYVERDDANTRIYPPNILRYEIGAVVEALETDPDVRRAQQVEAQNSPERAIEAYRNLLATARPAIVPEIQHPFCSKIRSR